MKIATLEKTEDPLCCGVHPRNAQGTIFQIWLHSVITEERVERPACLSSAQDSRGSAVGEMQRKPVAVRAWRQNPTGALFKGGPTFHLCPSPPRGGPAPGNSRCSADHCVDSVSGLRVRDTAAGAALATRSPVPSYSPAPPYRPGHCHPESRNYPTRRRSWVPNTVHLIAESSIRCV